MFDTVYSTALAHYGGWQQLIDTVALRLQNYLGFQFFEGLLQRCEMHPEQMLDLQHPAYICDAIALRCLQSYSPDEEDAVALERCIVDQLHHCFLLAESAEPAQPPKDGHSWNRYPLENALWLAWRQREQATVIVLYEVRQDRSPIENRYELEISPRGAILTRCHCQRVYELEADKMDNPQVFFQSMAQLFRLANEDRGYYTPDLVWLLDD